MAAKTKVIVTGDRKIDAALRRLGNEKLAKGIVRKAMRSSMKPILAASRANTPVETGSLRKSIKLISVRTRKGLKFAVIMNTKYLDPKHAGQAASVEFGSKHQDAQEPLKRAYDALAGSARDQCLGEVRAGILAAAKS